MKNLRVWFHEYFVFLWRETLVNIGIALFLIAELISLSYVFYLILSRVTQ